MRKFKYINEQEAENRGVNKGDFNLVKNEIQLEIAYQLKRIADKL